MKAEDYTPQNRAKFAEMMRDARDVRERQHLKTFSMCWLLDLSYPRADIAAVLSIVEREKGWK